MASGNHPKRKFSKKKKRACPSGKVEYHTEESALFFRKTMGKGASMYAYQCPDCGKWHLSRTSRFKKPQGGDA